MADYANLSHISMHEVETHRGSYFFTYMQALPFCDLSSSRGVTLMEGVIFVSVPVSLLNTFLPTTDLKSFSDQNVAVVILPYFPLLKEQSLQLCILLIQGKPTLILRSRLTIENLDLRLTLCQIRFLTKAVIQGLVEIQQSLGLWLCVQFAPLAVYFLQSRI